MSKKSSKNKQGIEIPSFIIKTGKVLQSISTSLTLDLQQNYLQLP